MSDKQKRSCRLAGAGPLRLRVLLCSLVGSLLIHALFLALFFVNWTHIFRIPHAEERLVVRLTLGADPSAARVAKTLYARAGEKGAVKERPALAPRPATAPGNDSLTLDPDEGYLPPELLSRAAIPEDEIKLEDIEPPASGSFRMQLWINSRGKVARIDVEPSDVPAWFTDQIVARFASAWFSPALRDDKRVASIMRVEVIF